MTKTDDRSGAWSRTDSTAEACASLSTTTAVAPESERIQATWSGLEVS
jgi:hypothetical protein